MLPQINVPETGKQIKSIMQSKGLSVKDIQRACEFTTPQAVYKWINGKNIPTVDNLVIVASLLGCRINDIVVVERSYYGG